jgi:4-hydroxymandelate oxidase
MELVDFEAQARALLAPEVYDFIAGGAFDELTLESNRTAWDAIRLRPRILRDVSDVSTKTSVLGTPLSHPVGVAPTAFHRMCHEDGERATAGGAADAAALSVLSTRSGTPIEDVATASGDSPWWFQIYILQDRGLTESLVQQAHAAGARALVLTGDTPVVGRRLRDIRNEFVIPDSVSASSDQDAGATFDDIAWLARLCPLPIVVKGVLRADDALRAIEAGAAAVWVSNHGGRQLDGAIATADALPEVVDAVGTRAEVHVDGGVRRGTDVLKALAIGARAVFVGRPVAWGLTVEGRRGVESVLRALALELELAMALAGARSIEEITPDLVAR